MKKLTDAPHHWFIATGYGYVTGDYLIPTLEKGIKENYLYPKGVTKADKERIAINIYLVPGTDEESHYDVDNFQPQANGTIFVACGNATQCRTILSKLEKSQCTL